jgi:hypothetical protein
VSGTLIVRRPLGFFVAQHAAFTDLTEQLTNILVVQLPGCLLAHTERLSDVRPRSTGLAGSRDRLTLPEVQLSIGSPQPAELIERLNRSQLDGDAHLPVVSVGIQSGRHGTSVPCRTEVVNTN